MVYFWNTTMGSDSVRMRIEDKLEDVGKDFYLDRAGIIAMLDAVLREKVDRRCVELNCDEVLASAFNKKLNDAISQIFRNTQTSLENVVKEEVRNCVTQKLKTIPLSVLLAAIEELEAK